MRRPWAAASAPAAPLWGALRIIWGFALAITILIIVRLFVLELVYVEGSSMAPTLEEGRVLIVNKLAYGLRRPFRFGYIFRWTMPRSGDVVAVRHPQTGSLIVKRVVAVPGTSIAVRGSALSIGEGAGRREFSVFGGAQRYFATITAVPQNMVLIAGDNPTYSVDSRHFGPVSLNLVSGRVTGTAYGK